MLTKEDKNVTECGKGKNKHTYEQSMSSAGSPNCQPYLPFIYFFLKSNSSVLLDSFQNQLQTPIIIVVHFMAEHCNTV